MERIVMGSGMLALACASAIGCGGSQATADPSWERAPNPAHLLCDPLTGPPPEEQELIVRADELSQDSVFGFGPHEIVVPPAALSAGDSVTILAREQTGARVSARIRHISGPSFQQPVHVVLSYAGRTNCRVEGTDGSTYDPLRVLRNGTHYLKATAAPFQAVAGTTSSFSTFSIAR